MQNIGNHHRNTSSSDDESSLHFPPQPNSSTNSFCSSLSHPSYMECGCNNTVPSSVFLDNLDEVSRRHANEEEQVDIDEQQDDSSYHVDIQNIDEALNYVQEQSQCEANDVTSHSTESSSAGENNIHHGTNSHHFGNKEYHHFSEMTRDEVASYKILSLLDSSGAPYLLRPSCRLIEEVVQNWIRSTEGHQPRYPYEKTVQV
jgi:hypothetical protein